ncbi:MAG: hypothetical protein M0P15_04375 [Bacteroides sp.]|nr:hypothetical protein [Bacteroides sp.]
MKLKFNELTTLINYSNFKRVTKKNSRNGVPYFVYFCNNDLSDDLIIKLNSYSNIVTGHAVSEFAPEQKSNVVFEYDKAIKK